MNNNLNIPSSVSTPTYTPENLREMETVLLKKIDKFNTEYSNYKKYL